MLQEYNFEHKQKYLALSHYTPYNTKIFGIESLNQKSLNTTTISLKFTIQCSKMIKWGIQCMFVYAPNVVSLFSFVASPHKYNIPACPRVTPPFAPPWLYGHTCKTTTYMSCTVNLMVLFTNIGEQDIKSGLGPLTSTLPYH